MKVQYNDLSCHFFFCYVILLLTFYRDTYSEKRFQFRTNSITFEHKSMITSCDSCMCISFIHHANFARRLDSEAYRAISHNGPARIIVRSQEPTYSLRILPSSCCSQNLDKFAPTLFECRKKGGGLVWTW